MTVWNLGLVGAGWFTAGLVWWWVLARVGLRFVVRDKRARPAAMGLRATLNHRATRLDQDIARRRAEHAVLN
jgi:hypothetical protein